MKRPRLRIAGAQRLVLFCYFFTVLALFAGIHQVSSQTFTNLHSFAYISDGDHLAAGLILSNNILYGTAEFGGASGNGTIFKVHTDGTGFTNLYSFTANSYINNHTNSDGANPYASLILSGNTLYGTATRGGGGNNGTVFKINTDGTCFTNLHSFTANSYINNYTNTDGANPYAGLILSGNTLYGTANGGGSEAYGTVFKINTDGTGFTNLHSFTALDQTYYTNSDGANPSGDLVLSGGVLYGTAQIGGSSGNGAVFKVNIDGTGFTNLHNFPAEALNDENNATNSDGANPYAGLILSGNTLYGTAYGGGSGANGAVFKVDTDGTGFTNLYSFTCGALNDEFNLTNSDGANPSGDLILSGNTLYGSATEGGSGANGTIFKINTDGTCFTNLYGFTALDQAYYTNSDGANPSSDLVLSGNTLYGTAQIGGSFNAGTVFSLSLGSLNAQQLAIVISGANVILTWPTNAIGFTLQSTTSLVPQAVWSTVSPSPIIVNGQSVVTNAISGKQEFYRLSQ